MRKTFNSRHVAFSLLLAFSITACNDDGDSVDPINEDQVACQMVKEAVAGDGIYTAFEYNAQGYVTKAVLKPVNSNANYDAYSTFTYNPKNQLVKIEQYHSGVLNDYKTFDYTGDLLTASAHFGGNGILYGETTYTYGSDKKLTETGHGDLIVKSTYDSKGNITKQESIMQGVVLYYTTYEDYDDKFTPYAAIKGVPAIVTGESRNNPGKTREVYDVNGDGVLQPSEVEITTYTYKYNEKGYPTEVKEINGSDTQITTYTYTCR